VPKGKIINSSIHLRSKLIFTFVKINNLMFQTIALLSPVFVSLFWAIILHGNLKKHLAPRRFLSKFMILLFVLFAIKFLNFEPLPSIYLYFDILHLYVGCLVFPVYHIYFRLLTIDEHFSWKAHARFLIIPTILGIIYAVGVLFTPWLEYKTFLVDKLAYPKSPQVNFLKFMYHLTNYYVMIQVIVYLIQNTLLLRKYGDRAEQFYSDIQDGKYNNARMLNYMLIINCVVTIICYLIFLRYKVMVYIFPTIYAVVAYMIGYMGFKQKPVNPTFDLADNIITENREMQLLPGTQKKIFDKLILEFEEKKIYLNSQLNIQDVVQITGSNRSYISAVINQQRNQNFCTFVNSYRIEELERIIHKNPDAAYEMLAERCGFGSVNSMKRAVSSKTGLSITKWKKQILSHQKIV
jgi:AraC-like DNA-binding protein